MGLRNMSSLRTADIESVGQREKRNGLKDICYREDDKSDQYYR
jgi:hypothetical protein